MPQCSYPSQVAYTSWQRYHNDIKVTSRDDILCECPDGHNYLDTKYDFTMEGEDSIVKIDYFCLPVSVVRLLSSGLIMFPMFSPVAALQRHRVLQGHHSQARRVHCQPQVFVSGQSV